jgi:hypothetical protein
MTHPGARATLSSLASGFVVFLIVQMVLLVDPPAASHSRGWFLDAGQNVLIIGLTLVVAAALLSAWRGRIVDLPIAFAFGAMLAMAATLFAVGPGNLFPIAIALGSAVIAAAVFTGTVAGFLVRSTVHLLRGSTRAV